jgi:transcriptional regulator with GAF, ATPase, and Fis domain/serine/threonine protein kinase
MSEERVLKFPERYNPVKVLGKGGGGEVWVVRDAMSGVEFALKVLSEGAQSEEHEALVREATALAGLEGLGVPRIVAFGTLDDDRRYMVREFVPGDSLEDVLEQGQAAWLESLAAAADQITILHRTGLLHGDIKPGNIIVGDDGRGTLVDLGLATPWTDVGSTPPGFTPKYAAPELFMGGGFTVRTEVYALGMTLGDALARSPGSLPGDVRAALTKVAERATQEDPQRRFPSVDELNIALRTAAADSTRRPPLALAWPIVGLDVVASDLLTEVAMLESADVLCIQGPAGSGRSTLARRASWNLGLAGAHVHLIEPALRGEASEAVVQATLRSTRGRSVLIVDDLDLLNTEGRDLLAQAKSRGARIVVVGERELTNKVLSTNARAFTVPPLNDALAEELLRRAVPSLPKALAQEVAKRVGSWPGGLRGFVGHLGARALVSAADIDEVLQGHLEADESSTRAERFVRLEDLVDRGRFGEAERLASRLGAGESAAERTRLAVATARIALARGLTQEAAQELDAARGSATAAGMARAWGAARARAYTRAGAFAEAASMAGVVIESPERDAIRCDALCVKGVALSYTGLDTEGTALVTEAVALATQLRAQRAMGVAMGSLAVVHQRAGRTAEARTAYESGLRAAEAANDAWTVASTRLNLAAVAHGDGDLAAALSHLEAALDMARRAEAGVAVEQALLNLANLDLYLGRYERADASLRALSQERGRLSGSVRAQLLGLEAEHALRTGDNARAAALYEECAEGYRTVHRAQDAAEAQLEALLVRANTDGADARSLDMSLQALGTTLGTGGFGEHQALASLAEASVAVALKDEPRAKVALDRAHDEAARSGRREWQWRALEARAKLFGQQGSVSLAKRDIETALGLLEETAARLPRDLREVFWNDPRRRTLRQSLSVTMPVAAAFGRGSVTVTTRHGSSTQMVRLADDRLTRILEITQELAREHDMQRLLSKVIDHAVALASAERGMVILVGDDGGLYVHTARDQKGDEGHASFSRSVAERVLETQAPVIAMHAQDDADLGRAVSVHKLSIQSVACVPVRGAPPVCPVIGALYLETKLKPGVRFKEELPTLQAFADQAAIAIENARLLAENRARAEELAQANFELRQAKDKLAGTLGRRTEQLATTRLHLKQARAQLRSHFGYGGLIGTSAPMRKLYSVIERVKDTDIPVLITGESGTGKEMVTRAIHGASERRGAPLLGINCGAIPENLLESELFGHVRGAFTGADRDRRGLFREAEGGTILLDEIGEMPLKMQAGLLRVLQEKKVRAVGATHEEAIDTRVVAATNRDLGAMVAQGLFREDLFYRLNVVEVCVPALRDRPEDIPPLIDHFLSLFAARYDRPKKAVERVALRKLCAYEWPGNVRQLEHVLLNAWLMGEGEEIVLDDLQLGPGSGTGKVLPRASQPPPTGPAPKNKEEFKGTEKERILAALASCNWNRVQAAKLSGVPRRTFYRRLKEYGIV